MAITIQPTSAVLAAGETVQFEAGGGGEKLEWTFTPEITGASLSQTGVFRAPPSISEPASLTVSVKDSQGASAKASVELIPDFRIVPAEIELKSRQAHRFQVVPAGHKVTWSLVPSSAGTLSQDGVYTPPPEMWLEQEALVVATSGKFHSTAKVRLSNENFIRYALVIYWVVMVGLLSWGLLTLWPKLCSTAKADRSIRVVPPLVTLVPEHNQPFRIIATEPTNQIAATWSASFGALTNNVYTVPAKNAPAAVAITATATAKPLRMASAVVHVSSTDELSLSPDFVMVSEGASVQFVPNLFVNSERKSDSHLLRWNVSPSDFGTCDSNGVYRAPLNVTGQPFITVTADYTNNGHVSASALVRVMGSEAWCSSDLFVQLALLLLFGAIGATIHGISSFVTYVGNRQFVPSWYLWYMFKPFQGAGFALAISLLARAGLLKMETGEGLLGASALAIMVGLFSAEASLKLADIAKVLFGSPSDKRSDKLDGSGTAGAPKISGATRVSGSTSIIVSGSFFDPKCVVDINGGTPRFPVFRSSTELSLTLSEPEFKADVRIVVINPDKQRSNAYLLPKSGS
jgi:hypothetical protein